MESIESDHRDWTAELPRFLGSLVLPFVAAGVGSAATIQGLRIWYPTLRKPSFNPPNWIFGPVWTTLYLLMGIADYLVARTGTDNEVVRRGRWIYRLQLALNALWSILFFGRRSPLAALIEIVFLWLAILITILSFARVSRRAALLLVPYLLWVTFATLLNEEIWRLNG